MRKRVDVGHVERDLDLGMRSRVGERDRKAEHRA
jgi:hypothetical protein